MCTATVTAKNLNTGISAGYSLDIAGNRIVFALPPNGHYNVSVIATNVAGVVRSNATISEK